MTLPNGIVVEYGYDAASQLTSLTYKNGSTVIGDLTYQYDQSGRRTRVGGSYARTGLPPALSGATYNAANRLTQRGATTLTYDANGNLTNDGVNSYTWNARNELVGISGLVSASFQYDAFARRTRKTIGGVTTDFLYDGVNVVQEKIGGTPSANLLTGGIDEIFSRTENTSESFLADGLGSTVSLLSSAGLLQTEYTYEPFGTTTVSGASNGNSSQYTGRENDGTGLYYYRARYYSPTLQRFISEDPIDFAGGDTNLYAYVSNNPCNFTDPSGQFLVGACLAGAAFGLGYDLLTGRKPTLESAVEGCAMGMLFGLAGRALGPLLRGLVPRLPKIPRGPGGAIPVKLGQKGEQAVRAAHDIGPKTPIAVNGRTRIPDGLNLRTKVLTEVKNVRNLSYTRQLRDLVQYASDHGLRLDLYVRPNGGTYLSGPLRNAINQGLINLRGIP